MLSKIEANTVLYNIMHSCVSIVLRLGGEQFLLSLCSRVLQIHPDQAVVTILLTPLEHSKLKAKVPPPEGTGLTTKEWKCLE